ncbi:MAG: response regulator [Nitrospinae bacterium]|nr:response regulator [Nitrospinota bacterium]
MANRVLLVDDDPNILKSYKRQLTTFFQVETAESAEIGLKTLTDNKDIAVVVTDLKMPGVNGLEFLEKVRTISPNSARIMLTGYPDQKTIVDAINTGGVSKFLEKPCSNQLLKSSIEEGFESFNLTSQESNTSKRLMAHNLSMLKEKVAEQNKKLKTAEKNINLQAQKHLTEKKSISSISKKQLEEEKLRLIEKLKDLEENNKGLKLKLGTVDEEIKKNEVLNQKLETIEDILANERNMHEKLAAEKDQAEENYKRLEDELKGLKDDKGLVEKIRKSVDKIKQYKEENLDLKDKYSSLQEKFKEKNVEGDIDKKEEIEKEITEQKIIIDELRSKLEAVNFEKKEIENYRQEIEILQNKLKNTPPESSIVKELEDTESTRKEFAKILKSDEKTFEVFKVALNNKTSLEQRINKLDDIIKKTKEHIEEIITENNESDSGMAHSTEVVDYLKIQIDKKESIKKLLINQKQNTNNEEEKQENIIIQKKNIKKHQAHGGSWKVAYADFVTAMMAFFLLMWLLSQLSQESRDNLQEYFQSYKAFVHSGDEKVVGSDSVRSADLKDKNFQERLIEEYKNRFSGSDEHLKVVKVAGGVRIQVMDITDKPMFEIGSAVFRPEAVEIFQFLAERIKGLPGSLIIEGHTDGLLFSSGDKTNWELSMERASTARFHLMKNGVDSKRLKRIVAYGHSEPINPDDHFDPKNRRINIILLNDENNKS